MATTSALPPRALVKQDILVVYDGVQLAHFTDTQGAQWAYLAIPLHLGKYDAIAVRVDHVQWQQYMEGRLNLRFIFDAAKTVYLVEDWGDNQLILVEYENPDKDEHFPDFDLTSAAHTHEPGEPEVQDD